MKHQKIIYLFIVIIFFLNQASAQNTTFSKIISTPLDESVKDVVEDSLGNFYFVGHNSVPGFYHTKTNGFVITSNNMGNVLDSITHYNSNESLEYYNIFFDDLGNIDVTGYSSTDFNRPHLSSKIELTKLSRELETIYSNNITLPATYGFQHLKTRRGFNDDFIFVSYVMFASEFYMNTLLLRVNNEFDSIKLVINLDLFYYGEDIKQLDTNKYWFTTANDRILLLDSMFQPTGQYGRVSHELNASYGIKWDSDTSFYLVGSDWYLGPDDVGFVKHYYPLDSTNSLFNYITTPDTNNYPAEYGGLDFNNKDSIFMGGTKHYTGFPFMEFPSWFFILQTDSLLNIRWERFYGGDAYYVMTKLKATQDGGCIAIGDRYDYKNTDKEERDIFILKLNSEGLLTSIPGKPKIQMHEAIVFPNPGTEFLRVRIAAQYPQSTFELFDMNGNLVLKENIEGKWKQISTSFLPQGTYVYKIHNRQGLFESGKWVKQ